MNETQGTERSPQKMTTQDIIEHVRILSMTTQDTRLAELACELATRYEGRVEAVDRFCDEVKGILQGIKK